MVIYVPMPVGVSGGFDKWKGSFRIQVQIRLFFYKIEGNIKGSHFKRWICARSFFYKKSIIDPTRLSLQPKGSGEPEGGGSTAAAAAGAGKERGAGWRKPTGTRGHNSHWLMPKKPSTRCCFLLFVGEGEEAVTKQPCHQACGPEKQAVKISIEINRGGMAGWVRAVQRTNCVNCRTNKYRAGSSYKVGREGRESTNDIESILMCNLKKRKKNSPTREPGDEVTGGVSCLEIWSYMNECLQPGEGDQGWPWHCIPEPYPLIHCTIIPKSGFFST